MPVDKFGRMSDTKTKDTGVSLTYINNNYVRSDGGTPISGSLDMRGNTIYNVADPVNPQDVVTKVYVDNTKGSGVIGRKIGDAVSIKENLDFMGKQKIKNLVSSIIMRVLTHPRKSQAPPILRASRFFSNAIIPKHLNFSFPLM